jgi:hypothetical protein
MWVEDATIRLHNGKIYIPFASDTGFFKPGGNREHISNTGL